MGRRPEGPPAEPGGKEVTADQARLAHCDFCSSGSMAGSTKLLGTDGGKSAPATKCGNGGGWRSLSACSTSGSWEFASPVDVNNLAAFDSAPSSTSARIFPIWDANIVPSSSILARALVRAGCSAGMRSICAFASSHSVSSCPAWKSRSRVAGHALPGVGACTLLGWTSAAPASGST